MAKRVTHFSHPDFVAFATRHSFGEAVAVAEAIARSGKRQIVNTSDDGTYNVDIEGRLDHVDGGLFLEGEELAKYQELRRKAWRKLRNQRKAERRAKEGKPYGQGAYTRVIPGDVREPVDRASKYVFEGRDKLKVKGFGPWG